MQEPPLVARARAAGAGPSSLGPLAHVLAARRGLGRVAVVDRDGVLGAWVVSALPPGVAAFLVEPGTQAVVLAEDPDARVLDGPWRQSLGSEAPFDLLVLGETAASEAGAAAAAAAALVPGGSALAACGSAGGACAEWLACPALAALAVTPEGGPTAVLAVRR